MQVQFYHLTNTNIEHTLPSLAQKALQASFKVCIKLANKEAVKKMDDWLWSYDPESFLPHAAEGVNNPEQQPVYLTTSVDNIANNAEIIMVTDGSYYEDVDGIERVLDIFDGNDEMNTQAARNRWRKYKNTSHELTYWQQQQGGGWKKAA